MKKSILFFLPVLMFSVLFTSCSKDDKDVTPDGNDEHFVSFKMDGETKRAEGTWAYGTEFSDTYNVYGIYDGGLTMYVAVDQNLGEGTHAMDDNTYALIAFEDGTGLATFREGGSGTVTVEERTATSLKGTFSYTAVNYDDPNHKIEVTEGAFNVVIRQ